MRIRVLGGGWFGTHLSLSLIAAGHDVELHEIADRLFSGASGNNPARLHIGCHYPRSRVTRAFCQEHFRGFMDLYGHLTRSVPVNVYAVAEDNSMMDFGTYAQVLRGEIEFITIERPEEFGLQNVEGAILVGERHIAIDDARAYFTSKLGAAVKFSMPPPRLLDDPAWDMTIDCTFCANEGAGVDRYEPCLVVLMEGPTDKAVTIMDGPFPSLYPWDEKRGLCSLSSAKFTPFTKSCRSWREARSILDSMSPYAVDQQAKAMVMQMQDYFPEIAERYEPAENRLSIRALPLSAADSRLVDVRRIGERAIRVRAGKIDAVLHAEKVILEMLQ